MISTYSLGLCTARVFSILPVFVALPTVRVLAQFFLLRTAAMGMRELEASLSLFNGSGLYVSGFFVSSASEL